MMDRAEGSGEKEGRMVFAARAEHSEVAASRRFRVVF